MSCKRHFTLIKRTWNGHDKNTKRCHWRAAFQGGKNLLRLIAPSIWGKLGTNSVLFLCHHKILALLPHD
jgi:hypothetical protein